MQQKLFDNLPDKRRQRVTVFISSPRDVREERQIALHVIQRFNSISAFARRFHLRALAYEDYVPATVGSRPQVLVDRYMMKAHEADLFICILWHRIGTPVFQEETGMHFPSGTVYEFLDAYHTNQQSGKPHILLYRCQRPPPVESEPDQLKQVQEFFARFEGMQAELKGLYKKYSTLKEFEEHLFHDLDTIFAKDLSWLTTMHLQSVQVAFPAHMLPSSGPCYGREEEFGHVIQWVEKNNSCLVMVLGSVGIGKTTLVSAVVAHSKEYFRSVCWQSLRNAPRLEMVLRMCLSQITGEAHPDSLLDELLSLLIEQLRQYRCLLVFDDLDALLEPGNYEGAYQAEAKEYERFFQSLAETRHQSCIFCVSREKPEKFARLQGKATVVRELSLKGIDPSACQEILRDKGLVGSDERWEALIHLYSGNPLYLKLASEPMRDLFNGDIATFLQEGEAVFGEMYDLLSQQFRRLSALETEIMYWLTIEREAVTGENVHKNMLNPTTKSVFVKGLTALRARSLLEMDSQGRMTLQPVMMNYVTHLLVQLASDELRTQKIQLLERYTLVKAQAKEYIREEQQESILKPVAENLLSSLGKRGLEQNISTLLAQIQQPASSIAGYAVGNLLNLLVQIGSDLHGLDCSHLVVRQAYLSDKKLPEVNFTSADLASTRFRAAFGTLFTLAFSPTHDLLAAAGTTGEVMVWQATTGIPLQIYQGHTDWVWSVVFSPDGHTLASAGYDQTIRLWEANSGQCDKLLVGHTGSIYALAFSPDGTMLVSAGEDMTIRIWDTSEEQSLHQIVGHTERITSLAFNSTGTLLASAGHDKTIRLWRVGDWHCTQVLQCPERVTALAFSPDGHLLASAGHDKTIHIWKVETGECNLLVGHADYINALSFSPNGNLISADEEGVIRIWESHAARGMYTLKAHGSRIRALALSSNGRLLASTDEDQTLRVWEVLTGRCLSTLKGYSGSISSVSFDGLLLRTSSDHTTAQTWNLRSGRLEKGVSVKKRDRQIVRRWEHVTGQHLTLVQGHAGLIQSVAFSPDETIIAGGGRDDHLYLWDAISGQQVACLLGHSGRIQSVAFSPDGTVCASGSVDQTLRLWELQTRSCLHVLDGHGHQIRSVVFSPDGETLASGGDDQSIRIWDIKSGEMKQVMRGRQCRIWLVAFNADGSQIANISPDGVLQFWEVQSGKYVTSFKEIGPYERMNITSIQGLSQVQRTILKLLGAIEDV